MGALESLYQELILDHSKHPRGRGLGEAAGRVASSHQVNPMCGDEITLQARVSDDGARLLEVSWEGAGCSISQASASMLSMLVAELADEGLTVSDAEGLIERFREALRSRGQLDLDEEVFGDAAALSGVSKFSARVKCAMLSWVALSDALARA